MNRTHRWRHRGRAGQTIVRRQRQGQNHWNRCDIANQQRAWRRREAASWALLLGVAVALLAVFGN